MKAEEHREATVMGGGLAGIVTALLLAKSGRKVRLIEAAPELGGLLKTFRNEDDVPFDYGTHIPKEIGIPGLDELLFGDLDQAKWQSLDRLGVGGFFRGAMYPTSQFIDLRQLPEIQRNAAVYEMLSTQPVENASGMSAEKYSLAMYGPTVTGEILDPLMNKLYGVGLSALQPSAIGLVGYSRFIGFDRFQTHEVKRSEFFDEKFGFTTWDDGISPLMNYYPSAGGIHIWMDGLVAQLEEFGVTLQSATQATGATISDGRVTSLEIAEGTIDVGDLYWTVSPAIFLKLAGEPFPSGMVPPKFRSTALIHLIFDRNFDTDLQFFYCHDIDKISYRTTLYSNLRSEAKGEAPFNCTIEVMADADTVNAPDLAERVLAEMKEMGAIGDDHQVTYQKVFASPDGFPLPTTGFGENSIRLTEHCLGLAENLTMLGRATGKTHFMHEVLAEIWQVIGEPDGK